MRTRRPFGIVLSAIGAGWCIAGSAALAGPIDPPPGPVAPTGATQLSDALTPLPHTITAPGSYILTGNLTGVTGQSGIIIAASDVTLDLNGFTIAGDGASLIGVRVLPEGDRCTIRNGNIRGWGDSAIRADAGAVGVRVEKVHASLNTNGIWMADEAVVSDCIASHNSGIGVRAGDDAVARACEVRANAQGGILVFDRALIEGCAASGNTGSGIKVSSGLVRGCLSASNTGPEIEATNPSATLLIDNQTLP